MSDIGDATNLSLGAFIRQAIGEGMGVTEARNTMRDLGVGSLSNEAFGELYGEIRAAIGQRSALAGLDYEAIPGADVLVPWSAGNRERYATFVEVFVREQGTRVVTSRFHTHISDAPHTPQEAVDAAIQTLADAARDEGTDFDAVVLTGMVTSMTKMTGGRR